MANPAGIVSNQDLSELYRSYVAAFVMMADLPDPIEDRISRVVQGSGQEIAVHFMTTSAAPSVQNLGDERKHINVVERNKATIAHKPIYPPAIRQLYDVIMSSPGEFSMFQNMLQEYVAQGSGIWREMLAKVMNDARLGTLTSYDGVAFFSTVHKVNPTVPALLTQSNYLPNTKMSKAAAIAALQLIDNMKGHDGRRINRGGNRMLRLVVPTEDLRIQAAEVWTAEVIAQAVGANAAVAIKNQLPSVEIIKFPELADYSTKASYLLDMTSPVNVAFCVSKVRNVTPYFTGLNPSDEVRRVHFSVEAGYDAYGGAGVLMHQKAICIEAP